MTYPADTLVQNSVLTGDSACPAVPGTSLRIQRLLLRTWLVATDALALALAFFAAYWMRFDLQVTTAPEVLPMPFFYTLLAAALIPVLLVVFELFRLYDPHLLLGGVTEYSRIFHACSTGTMIVVVGTFLVPQFVVSRFWVLAAWLLTFLLVAASRFVSRRMVYMLRRRGYFLTPTLIVGTNEEAVALMTDLGDWRSSGLRVVGLVSNATAPSDLLGGAVLGTVEDVPGLVEKHGIGELVVAITAVGREDLLRLCEDVNGMPNVHLRLSSGLYELLTTGLTVRTMGSVPLVSLNHVRLDPGEAATKSVVEYALSMMGLVALFPLLVVVAVLIKLDSAGPVLHRRRVLGVGGKPFDAFKFRTMRMDGDELMRQNPELQRQLETEHKLKDDPRVTRVGRWLRKYSLDELPQLFNVVLGQMGLVGPRMITEAEVEKYGRHHLNLLTVKPGITGLWQVSGRSDLSYDERVNLDMYYIRNYSVWLDLQILFVQTLPAVLRGRGAY